MVSKFLALTIPIVLLTSEARSELLGENLLFSPPNGFSLASQLDNRRSLISEWVPATQSIHNWSELITVQIFRGLRKDPEDFLRSIRQGFVIACSGTSFKEFPKHLTNGYSVSVLIVECPKNPKTQKPETTVFRVINGRDALYSVQHAWRSLPTSSELNRELETLSGVTVCDTREPDHPCPNLSRLPPGQ
jgi:hypothetical protein